MFLLLINNKNEMFQIHVAEIQEGGRGLGLCLGFTHIILKLFLAATRMNPNSPLLINRIYSSYSDTQLRDSDSETYLAALI